MLNIPYTKALLVVTPFDEINASPNMERLCLLFNITLLV